MSDLQDNEIQIDENTSDEELDGLFDALVGLTAVLNNRVPNLALIVSKYLVRNARDDIYVHHVEDCHVLSALKKIWDVYHRIADALPDEIPSKSTRPPSSKKDMVVLIWGRRRYTIKHYKQWRDCEITCKVVPDKLLHFFIAHRHIIDLMQRAYISRYAEFDSEKTFLLLQRGLKDRIREFSFGLNFDQMSTADWFKLLYDFEETAQFKYSSYIYDSVE